MPDQEQQFSTGPGSFRTVLRLLGALAVAAVAIALVTGTWDDTATGEAPMHIFFVGWTVAALVISVGFALAGLARRPVLPPAVQHVAVGLVVGLAIGTTDWADLRLAGWWQLWWTVPLLLAYGGLLVTLRRSLRTRP